MKAKHVSLAALLVFLGTAPLLVQAATDADKSAEAAVAAKDAKVEQVPQKKMKRHSHLEEKTGVAQKEPVGEIGKPNAAADRSKHHHPRDGK